MQTVGHGRIHRLNRWSDVNNKTRRVQITKATRILSVWVCLINKDRTGDSCSERDSRTMVYCGCWWGEPCGLSWHPPRMFILGGHPIQFNTERQQNGEMSVNEQALDMQRNQGDGPAHHQIFTRRCTGMKLFNEYCNVWMDGKK